MTRPASAQMTSGMALRVRGRQRSHSITRSSNWMSFADAANTLGRKSHGAGGQELRPPSFALIAILATSLTKALAGDPRLHGAAGVSRVC